MSDKKPASRVIALEEAFLHPKVWEHYPEVLRQRFRLIKPNLMDVGPERIKRMDAAGIDLQVLSHVQPGVQMIEDAKVSISLCREVNDWLGEVVKTYPTRFAGFAMLPTQSPKDAAEELERTVTQFGFKGALINGHTNERYLDHPSFSVMFKMAETLDVPIYIHPTDPPKAVSDVYYKDHPALIPGWGWLVESGTHVLKMMAGGVFDRHPQLKIIIGHMGEMLPYTMTRLEQSLTFGEWLIAAEEARDKHTKPMNKGMQKNVPYYMRHNIFITTSGVFDQPVFDCARKVIGIDNLLFSVDDPFRDNFEAMDFLRDTKLSTEDKEKLAHGNAESLLKLPHSDGSMADTSGNSLQSAVYGLRAKMKSKFGRALISMMVK